MKKAEITLAQAKRMYKWNDKELKEYFLTLFTREELEGNELTKKWEEEVWLPISGFKGEDFTGFYEVSNLGRVRSLDRETYNHQGVFLLKGCILKQIITKKGYCRVGLNKNRKLTNAQVHRLVAEMFIPNPDNLPQVNHKNGIKADNRVENLEHVSSHDNVKHSYDSGLKYATNKRAVLQFTEDGTFVCRYESITEAVQKNEGFHAGTISKVCSGSGQRKRTFHKGFRWKYADEYYNSLFATEKQRIAMEAFAQLSQIAAEANKRAGYEVDWDDRQQDKWCIIRGEGILRIVNPKSHFYHISFHSKEAAEESLLKHRILWEQFWEL